MARCPILPSPINGGRRLRAFDNATLRRPVLSSGAMLSRVVLHNGDCNFQTE